MATICTDCGGKGRKRIAFFRTKVCGTCNGKGYVRSKPPAPFTSSQLQQGSDGITITDVALASVLLDDHDHKHVEYKEETFAGHGGEFGGAGATGHYDAPVSQPDSGSSSSSDSSSSSSDSSSSSSSDSGGSSGGGD